MPSASYTIVGDTVALTVDPRFTVRVERRLTDRSRVIYVTVNASQLVTVNGEPVE